MKSLYPWQQPLWQQWLQQWQQRRVAHALLLSGASGMGKHAFAQAMAMYILCEAKKDAIFACGNCKSCQLFIAGNHPDFYGITIQEKSKWIRVEQIRAMTLALNQTAQRSHYQVVLIDPAEKMNIAAANALLKTLEEPAGEVLFLLITAQPNILPATILSRCQRIYFTQPDIQFTLPWLQQQIENSQQAEILLKAAEHAPLRALKFSQQGHLEEREQWLKQLLQIQQGADPLTAVNFWLKRDFTQIFNSLLQLVHDIVRVQWSASQRYLYNPDLYPQLQRLALSVSEVDLCEFWQRVQKAYQNFQQTNALNQQLLLEDLLLQWMKITEIK